MVTRHRRSRRLRLLGMVLLGTAMAACSGKDDKPPPVAAPKPADSIEISVAARADVNPDVAGRASPVLVRIYELKDQVPFITASFLALFGNDTAVLGNSLQARQELMLNPGQGQTLRREARPETRFIAVMTAYQDFEHASWRAITAVPPNATTMVQIVVGRLATTIERED
jgi:type VI secretion system protein VasD